MVPPGSRNWQLQSSTSAIAILHFLLFYLMATATKVGSSLLGLFALLMTNSPPYTRENVTLCMPSLVGSKNFLLLNVQKDFLSQTDQVYYKRILANIRKHYNYFQVIYIIYQHTLFTKVIKMPRNECLG
jgi:hypothetical protein